MSKICPQCNEPNPDRLNFCGYCGAKLDLDGELDDHAKLHNELAKSRELLQMYKQQKESLEKANKDLLLLYNTLEKESEKTKSIDVVSETLNKKIAEQNLQIKNLTQQLSAAQKKKSNAGWAIFFLLICIIASGFAIYYYNLSDSLNFENDSLKKENHSFENRLDILKSTQQNISDEKEKLEQKLEGIVEYYPIIINSLKIGNVDSNGNIETDYGNTIYASNSMYLKPQIEYIGLKTNQTIALYLKLYKNGVLSTGASSPSGYSIKYDLYVDAEGTSGLMGWGNSTKGNWSSGSYRYEIWYNNMCLKVVDFNLY